MTCCFTRTQHLGPGEAEGPGGARDVGGSQNSCMEKATGAVGTGHPSLPAKMRAQAGHELAPASLSALQIKGKGRAGLRVCTEWLEKTVTSTRRLQSVTQKCSHIPAPYKSRGRKRGAPSQPLFLQSIFHVQSLRERALPSLLRTAPAPGREGDAPYGEEKKKRGH